MDIEEILDEVRDTKYVCEYCQGVNVMQRGWFDPNTGEIFSNGQNDRRSEGWCNDCQKNVFIIENCASE